MALFDELTARLALSMFVQLSDGFDFSESGNEIYRQTKLGSQYVRIIGPEHYGSDHYSIVICAASKKDLPITPLIVEILGKLTKSANDVRSFQTLEPSTKKDKYNFVCGFNFTNSDDVLDVERIPVLVETLDFLSGQAQTTYDFLASQI